MDNQISLYIDHVRHSDAHGVFSSVFIPSGKVISNDDANSHTLQYMRVGAINPTAAIQGQKVIAARDIYPGEEIVRKE